MNHKKVAFITCVNDQFLYEESKRYIKSLHVPEGYEIELIGIENASSMTEGYNRGMKQSDAKYKVYMHQDVLIINKHIIYEIITLFEKFPKCGLLGVVGSKTIPNNGIWWESTQRFGKVYDSHTGVIELLSFKDIGIDFEPVQALDGLLMITQYDIPWREDIFTGWHYYDISQCQEFILNGYEVGVIHQSKPWCIHDCGIVNVENNFNKYRELFMQVYGENVRNVNKKFLPLVSILIPAYNRPHYLEIALKSVLEQTYPNIEIIITDDSTNDDVKDMITPYLEKYSQIRYYKNEQNLFVENFYKCFDLAKGEFVNYLMDDDLFHPEKIEAMVNSFMNNPNVTLVTSYRKMIDENGNPLPDNLANATLFNQDTLISGVALGNYVLSNCINSIGEPTTVLFRKKDLTEKFGYYRGKKYECINDLASWILLLSKGNAVYLSRPLSYFRQHQGQNQKQLSIIAPSIRQWFSLINDSREDGFLNTEQDYKKALSKHLQLSGDVTRLIVISKKYDLFLKEEVNTFLKKCVDELTQVDDPFECPY